MITLPAAFEQARHNRSSGACWILELRVGTTPFEKFYFARKNIDLPDVPIYVDGIVTEFGPIRHSVDPGSFAYEHAGVRVELSAQWNTRDAADAKWRRFLDLIRKQWLFPATIHWFPGGYANGLTDGITIFLGTTTKIEYIDSETIAVFMDDRNKINHRRLPQNFATRDTFPQLTHVSENVEMPLQYGDASEGIYQRQTGFFPCMLLENHNVSTNRGILKYLVADHVCYAVTTLWFKLSAIDSWCEVVSGLTTTLNDGGRTTCELALENTTAYAYVYPTDGYVGSSATDASNTAPVSAAFDNDPDSKVSVIAHSTTEASVTFEWTQQGSEVDSVDQNGVASLLVSGTYLRGIEAYRSVASGVTVSSFKVEVWDGGAWVTFDTSTQTGAMQFYDFAGGTWGFTGAKGVFWHFASGPSGGDGTPFKVKFTFTGSGWTADSTVVAYLHEVRLRLKITYPHDINIRNVYWTERRGGLRQLVFGRESSMNRQRFHARVADWIFDADSPIATNVFAEMRGREYGAWIDNTGRSNSYNAGDPITNPVGIIESILRDELGLSTAEIDQDSFDTAYSASGLTQAWVSLTSSRAIDSRNLIEKIGFEHGLFVYRTHAGVMRIVDYKGTGTTVATLTPDDLDGIPMVSVRGPVSLINDLTILHTRLEHDDTYERISTASDSTSQSEYGTYPGRVKLDTIRTFAPPLAALTARFEDRLVTTECFWSRPHRYVTLKTVGAKFAHAELCDIFNLSTDFDHVALCAGDSWSGLDLMIIAKEMTETGVTFETLIWAPPDITTP